MEEGTHFMMESNGSFVSFLHSIKSIVGSLTFLANTDLRDTCVHTNTTMLLKYLRRAGTISESYIQMLSI